MRSGTWNVMSQYRAGSLTAVARELARCTLDLLGVQEVRWDKYGTESVGNYKFFYVKETKIMNWDQDILQHRIVSAVKRVDFVNDRL
jgi:hypothetical protein